MVVLRLTPPVREREDALSQGTAGSPSPVDLLVPIPDGEVHAKT